MNTASAPTMTPADMRHAIRSGNGHLILKSYAWMRDNGPKDDHYRAVREVLVEAGLLREDAP